MESPFNTAKSKAASGAFSRRSFIKGGLVASAAAFGGAALAGCAAPAASEPKGSAGDAGVPTDEITARLAERVKGADLPDAAPIMPADPLRRGTMRPMS